MSKTRELTYKAVSKAKQVPKKVVKVASKIAESPKRAGEKIQKLPPLVLFGLAVVLGVGLIGDGLLYVKVKANASTTKPIPSDQWIDNVELTHYTVALERNLQGQKTGDSGTINNPPNVQGTFYKEFLYSGWGVAMQGTGISLDGRYIKWISGGGGWNQTSTWLNDPASAVFTQATGVIGKSGRTLTEWSSAAVDPSVVPLGWYIWIDSEQAWFRADDTGGKIIGKHIDIYVGLSTRRPISASSKIYITANPTIKPPARANGDDTVLVASKSGSCVEYVKARLGIPESDAVGNAWKMGPALISRGFHPVDDPSPGAVVIFQPDFGGVNSEFGHVGIVESAKLENENWSISVRGANQTPSGHETEYGYNNVNTVAFAPYAKSKGSIAYFVK